MNDKMKCPFCGVLQDLDYVEIDYSGDSFEVKCEDCEKIFLCQVSIGFTCSLEGVWTLDQYNSPLKNITTEVLKKLGTPEVLYRWKDSDFFLYSFLKMDEKFMVNGIEGRKGDYIRVLYQTGKTKEKIDESLLSFASKQYFEEFFEEIGE